MENRTSATADGDKRRRLSALGAARQEPARYAPASRDGRASLWHATHFMMKRLPKVATEMALHVLAYNLTRVMNIMGIQPLMAAIGV